MNMKHSDIGYRDIMHQREYCKMILANIINRLGDSIDMIAFSWIIYEISGSASYSALMIGINMLPTILIQPFSGVVVEKLNKKQVMVICDIIRCILTAMIALCYYLGVLTPWLMLLITFLNNAVEAFRGPAGMAFVPKLLEKAYYEYGMALNQSVSRIMEIIGIGLAGIILGSLGPSFAILMDAISFFLSAMIIVWIHNKEVIMGKIEWKLTTFMDDLKGGFQYLKQLPIVFIICFIGALMNVLLIPIDTFQVPYTVGLLQYNAEIVSLNSIALIFGLAMGAFLYPTLHKRIHNRILLCTSVLSFAMLYLGLSYIPNLVNDTLKIALISSSYFMCGLGCGIISSLANVSFMKFVEVEYMARAGSIFNAIATSMYPIMSIVLSIVSAYYAIPIIFACFGILSSIVFFVMIRIKIFRQL